MTQEFDRVRAAFASSMPGRMLSAVKPIIKSGWSSSSFASAMRRRTSASPMTSTAALIRAGAIAVVIAVVMQPLLMRMMARTARPWMPLFAFVAIALLAAAAAWQPDKVAIAWPQSRFARWLRR